MMNDEQGAQAVGTGGDTEGVVAELPPEARHAVDRVRELARARPLMTAGIATGIGYVLANGMPRVRVVLIGAALGYGIFRILRHRRAAAAGASDDAAASDDDASDAEDGDEEEDAVAGEATADGADGQTTPRKQHRRHKPKRAHASSER